MLPPTDHNATGSDVIADWEDGARSDGFKSLNGYTILDLTQYLSGPLCSMTLATLGADVIKVEPPAGDGNRGLPPFVGSQDVSDIRLHPEDESLVFIKRNQGKRSIVLDLKTEAGQGVLHELMRKSDVLLHNFRPGVAKRLGIDKSTAQKVNPALICCEIAGQFGQIGDPIGRPDYPAGGVIDLVGQALSGLLGTSGSAGEPTRSRAPIADQVAGLYATVAVLAAIVGRDNSRGSGKTQAIRVPMVESLAALLWDESLDSYLRAGYSGRAGNASGRLSPYNTYLTRDQKLVAIAAASPGEWTRLVTATNLKELEAPTWLEASNRSRDRETIDQVLCSWVATLDCDDVIHTLRLHGVTVGAVLEAEDMIKDGPYRESVLYEVDGTSEAEPALAPRFPLEINGIRLKGKSGNSPKLGADGRDILRRVCGFREHEISQLMRRGAFASMAYGKDDIEQRKGELHSPVTAQTITVSGQQGGDK